MRNFLFLCIPLVMLFAFACSTSEKTIEGALGDISGEFADEKKADILKLESLRTTLADAYANKQNTIPEAFDKTKVLKEVERNLYEGYRIQIFSGENVDYADTTAGNFRAWADTTLSGYQPQTYVFFKTPYYRVHVGDFHDRDKAIQFSNIVKRFFKDAWVVYDNVDPEHVPADTTTIEMIRKDG